MQNKVLILIGMMLLLFSESHAQRFAYVDTEYILENVPEYERAKKELRSVAEEWRDEIRRKKEGLADARREYEAEKVLLPEETREQRRQDLKSMEEDLEQYREEKFGSEGELFARRDQLIQPIKDRVFDAVQEMARDGALDFVFDRAGAVTMLYYSVQYDRSDEVLKEMGIDPPDERDETPDRREGPDGDDRPDSDRRNGQPDRSRPDRPDGSQRIQDDTNIITPGSQPDEDQRQQLRPDQADD